MQIVENSLSIETYNTLRKTVGWSTFSDAQVEKALHNSLYTIVIKENNQPIAMGRIIGDNALYYYIQDIVVNPNYQGQGIGTKIIQQLLQYVEKNILPDTTVTVGLFAAKGKEEFYQKFNFIIRPNIDTGHGMMQKMTNHLD